VSRGMQDARTRKILSQFGDRVREARRIRGFSQEVLAERSGLHRTYIGTVERGERNPALVNLIRIADALEVDVSSLVRGLTLGRGLNREVRK
jgi:transcriptional regulator with XRE-family HTH domain